MSYYGYICELKNVRAHPNADRIKLATVFGNTICVDLGSKDGDSGVYFPTDGQLSEEFCAVNDLVRRKDENGNPAGGYLDPAKRNVKTVKLRGEPSDGLFLPISCLDYCYSDRAAANHLKIGDRIDIVNGHPICQKYIPRSNVRTGKPKDGNRTRKRKIPVAPLFAEHADTEQLAYNLGAFLPGDQIEITLKMHGTSGRTAYLPVLQGYKRSLWDKLRKREGIPVYDWGYVSGTRRVVLNDYGGGYYGSNEFREPHSKFFEGKLLKGESIYYEIVGFTHTGTPIMATGDNKKLGKDFVKQYGDTTIFSYGCSPNGKKMMYGNDDEGLFAIGTDVPQSDIYVYRMTMTNEDGNVIEYTPDFMRYRCEQMGVKTVPIFWKGYIPEYPGTKEDDTVSAGEWVMAKSEMFVDGADPVGKTHIREGVVVRIINRPKFCAYKSKSIDFKVLEGLVKESAVAPDMEEAQEITKE